MVEKETNYFWRHIENRKKFVGLIVWLILYIVVYVVQFRNSIVLERAGISEQTATVILYRNIQGVISVAQIFFAVMMVINSRLGYYISMILMNYNLIALVSSMIVKKQINSIPGIAILAMGIVLVIVLHGYLSMLGRKEKELLDLVNTDVLTELPNRRALKQKMKNLMDDTKHNNQFAVAIVDIDDFKNINDTVGHDYGDKMLLEVSNRFSGLLRKGDFMARLGGDEFALLVSNYDGLAELDTYMKSFLNVLADPFILKDNEYKISSSAGVALYPGDAKDEGQLLKCADMAMFAAKKQGKNRISYFDSMMGNDMEASVAMERKIRRALETDSFFLVYQPQYTSMGKKLRGFETLVRMRDEDGKQVSPGAFIPVAEKSSLIIDIDKWVMRHAMLECKKLVEINSNIIVSINISGAHMLEENFIADLDNCLKETGFNTDNLELELTESVFVESLAKAKSIMDEIKDRGIHIALDDFGTGYSSLSYLRELPIDMLKIDKAFVDNISSGKKDEDFVSAIISLSKAMQYDVISEGVELDDQLDILRRLQCDFIQGFIWGKPQEFDIAMRLTKDSGDQNIIR